jgi:hypothetical protein
MAYKYNNGNGAIICDDCSVIIQEPVPIIPDKDDTHLCLDCLAKRNKMNAYIHYHEYDYACARPTLVLQHNGTSVGYSVDPDTLEIIDRVCICEAWNENECVCGGWE